MKNSKAFTFFELLIVLILVLSVYGLFFSSFDFTFNKKESSVNLKNLKSYLRDNFSFSKNLRLVCIEEGEVCYVFLDDTVSKDNKLSGLFKSKPEIYKYSDDLDHLDFNRVDFGDLEEYDVVFEYNINKDRKSDDVVVDVGDKVYVFTSIHEKPFVFKYLSEVSDMFEEQVSEVKDAF